MNMEELRLIARPAALEWLRSLSQPYIRDDNSETGGLGHAEETIGEILDECNFKIIITEKEFVFCKIVDHEYEEGDDDDDTKEIECFYDLLKELEKEFSTFGVALDVDIIYTELEQVFLFDKCPKCSFEHMERTKFYPVAFRTTKSNPKATVVSEYDWYYGLPEDTLLEDQYFCPECGLLIETYRDAEGEITQDDTGIFSLNRF